MIEFLTFIAVIAIVVIAIKLGRQDNYTTEPSKAAKTQENVPQHGWQYMSLIGEVLRQAKERGDAETVQEATDLTYEGAMPKRKPDGTYTSIYNPVWDYNISGINYRKGIKKYVGEFFGYLQPEPTNEYDPEAIAIYHSDGHHLGYIPQNCTDDIRDLDMQFPLQVFGGIEEDYDEDEHRRYFRGTIYLEIEDKNATRPYIPRVCV